MRSSTVYMYRRGVGGWEWSLESATDQKCYVCLIIVNTTLSNYSCKTVIIMTMYTIMLCVKINGHIIMLTVQSY